MALALLARPVLARPVDRPVEWPDERPVERPVEPAVLPRGQNTPSRRWFTAYCFAEACG